MRSYKEQHDFYSKTQHLYTGDQIALHTNLAIIPKRHLSFTFQNAPLSNSRFSYLPGLTE